MAFPNYDKGSPFGQRIASAVGYLRLARAEFDRGFNAADAIAYSGGGQPDFTLLEKDAEDASASGNDFGVAAGGGEAFRNALNGVRDHLGDVGFLDLLNKLDRGQ